MNGLNKTKGSFQLGDKAHQRLINFDKVMKKE